MSGLLVIRADERRRIPWKNGGGETLEIAVEPRHADLIAFDWRISAARVATDGPFSCFPGVDRTLCLLAGSGMELAIEGRSPIALSPDPAPLSFRADVPTVARLVDGPIEDLNIMTRRGRFSHLVQRAVLSGPIRVPTPEGVTTVICAREPVKETGSQTLLYQNDTLVCTGAHGLQLQSLSGAATVFLIQIIPVHTLTLSVIE